MNAQTGQPQLPIIADAVAKEKADKAEAAARKAEEERKSKYKDLVANNPPPKTKQQAMDFCRRWEKTKDEITSVSLGIFPKKGGDLVRIVLKTENNQGGDVKHEEKKFIPIEDQEEYEIQFAELAHRAWQRWLAIEEAKQS